MIRRAHASRRHNRGIALIISLLVVSIVTALALLFTARQQLWMRQIENRNNFSMAVDAAIAAIDMCRLTLRDDARRNQYDHLLEPWTIPIPPISVEEGKLGGRITEQQGRLNLTNLLPAGREGAPDNDASIARAARAFGVTSSTLSSVLRAYQTLRKLEPRGTPEFAELASLAGIGADSRASLERHVVVLPEKTPVNVNFATPEVLQASIEGLSSSEAQKIVSDRTGNPFKTLDDFQRVLPAGSRAGASSAAVTVQSSYFLVDIDAWFNEMHTGYQALLHRDGNRLPQVVWARRSKLGTS